MNRGQSNVVGVALLLGIAVISMGTLTAAIGVVVESSAAEVDAERVASDFDAAFEPVAASGPQRGTVTFSEGRLYSVERTLEIRENGTTFERVAVDSLVFESGDRTVTFHAGAIVRGSGDSSWMAAPPPLTVGEDVIVIGVPRLGDVSRSVAGSGGVTATIDTRVSHDRRDLGNGTYSIAVETDAPNAWGNYFREQGATVRMEPAETGTVVGTFEGDRTGYLVVHDLETEVSGGG